MLLDGVLLNQLMSAPGLADIDFISGGNRERREELFRQAEKVCAEASPAANSAFAYAMLVELSEIPGLNTRRGTLRRAVEFLRANTHRRVSVPELSRNCAVTPAALTALFNRELRTTPRRYHEQLRLDYAGDLLERLRKSVKEAAFMAGFASPQYFATRFKKRFGCSPGEVSSGKLPLFRIKTP